MLILPGLFVGVVFSLAVPCLVIRGAGILESLRMSWKMTKGYRLEILGLLFVYGFTVLLVALVITLPPAMTIHFAGLDGTVVQEVVLLVIDAFFTGAMLVVGGAIWAIIFRFIEADAAAVAA